MIYICMQSKAKAPFGLLWFIFNIRFCTMSIWDRVDYDSLCLHWQRNLRHSPFPECVFTVSMTFVCFMFDCST